MPAVRELDRKQFSERIRREQRLIVRRELTPNCAGGRYSGQQVHYIHAEADRRATAIVDRRFAGTAQ